MFPSQQKQSNAWKWNQHLEILHASNRDSDSQDSVNQICLLQEEKADLELRFTRQRKSLAMMAALLRASREPLATLPLEPQDPDYHNNMDLVSAQEAMVLTVTNLRCRIENMQEEREKLTKPYKRACSQNCQLRMENQAQALKIAKLEELVAQLQSRDAKKTTTALSG